VPVGSLQLEWAGLALVGDDERVEEDLVRELLSRAVDAAEAQEELMRRERDNSLKDVGVCGMVERSVVHGCAECGCGRRELTRERFGRPVGRGGGIGNREGGKSWKDVWLDPVAGIYVFSRRRRSAHAYIAEAVC
jgi:hypothetical protein